MTKGTASVGFLLTFIAGMGLMWGISRNATTAIGAETARATSQGASSPLPIASDDPVWGKPDAPVTLIELSDFECPYCGRAAPTVQRLQREYGAAALRVVWKNAPLPGHEHARPAAEAGATVQGLGGDYWKFNELAFAHQKELNPENFERWAVTAGVSAERFRRAFQSKQFAPKVDRDLALFRQLGVHGTPYFLVNGKPLSGALPFESFKSVIDQQLSAANALAQRGTPRSELSLELTRKNFTAPAANPAQKAAAPPPEDTTLWKLPVGPDDPTRGSARALVTIVTFSDFQCPYCARVETTLKKLLADYGDDLRIVWKDDPMSFHARARPAAALARFAFETKGNDAFWSAHDALFENQKDLEDTGLEAIAGKLGLDWHRVKAAIDDGRYTEQLDQSSDLATDLEVPGTPHFFINGRHLSGAQPYEEFKALIDTQLVAARALATRGVSREAVYRELMKTAKEPPPPARLDVPAPTSSNPQRGAEHAKIVIHEFSDFQCPFCGRAEPTLAQLLREQPKDVKVVWHDYPLPFHEHALLASEAGREAFAQGGNEAFWKYHDLMFQHQNELERADLERYAAQIGLDLSKFRAALDSHAHKAEIDADSALGTRAGVNSTPAFGINGRALIGAQPIGKFTKLMRLPRAGG